MVLARAGLTITVIDSSGNVQAGASVTVYEEDGSTLLVQPMYSAKTGGTALANPTLTNNLGRLTLYAATAQRVVLSVGGINFVSAFESDPADIVLESGSQALDGKTLTSATVGLVDGTAAAPALSFTNDPNTGVYSSAADELAVAAGGAKVAALQANGIRVPDASTVAAPAVSFLTDIDTGLYNVGANVLGVAAGGAQVGTFQSTGLRVPDAATAALPAVAFVTDTNTGVYNAGADVLGLAVGGAAGATVQSTGVRVPDAATAALPAVAFITDTDTGIYNVGANQLGVATGGTLRGTWSSSGLAMGANLPVVPGAVSGTPAANAGYQESLIKGWVNCGVTGNILDSFNVSSLSDRGTGQVDVVWDRDFSSANYAVVGIVKPASGSLVTVIDATQGQAAGTVTIDAFNAAGSVTDPVFYDIIAIGKQ